MHPAFSVLFFTVTSGMGYGFAMMLILTRLSESISFSSDSQYMISFFIALVMITAGLMSSTFHLANLKNAWRAFSRFKTSWLSREGVFAVLYYPLALAYGITLWFNDFQVNSVVLIFGVLTVVIGLVLTYCTAMIYASLKTIPQWHNAYIPTGFLLFSVLGGVLCLNLTLVLARQAIPQFLVWAGILFCVVAMALKLKYFNFIGRPTRSTIKSATTFTQANVRLFDTGHSADNFLQKEFAYEVGPKTLHLARKLSLIVAFALPLIAILLQYTSSGASIALAVIAVLASYIGLLLERWLFFIEAKHVVRLYYGKEA